MALTFQISEIYNYLVANSIKKQLMSYQRIHAENVVAVVVERSEMTGRMGMKLLN